MSLKAFHVVFITVSTLLCAGFAAWSAHQYLATSGTTYLALALAGFSGAVGLPVYGVWFLKKMKKVSYL